MTVIPEPVQPAASRPTGGLAAHFAQSANLYDLYKFVIPLLIATILAIVGWYVRVDRLEQAQIRTQADISEIRADVKTLLRETGGRSK